MEIFIAVLVLLAGMMSNWYLQRREFRELARMHERSEERVTRILDGIKDILDRMEKRISR